MLKMLTKENGLVVRKHDVLTPSDSMPRAVTLFFAQAFECIRADVLGTDSLVNDQTFFPHLAFACLMPFAARVTRN